MSDIRKRNTIKIWLDVIFALFIREMRVRFNDKFGISWAVIQPVSFILILSVIRGRISGQETYGIPTFIFIAYGLLLIQLFLQTFSAASSSIRKNKPLFAFRQVQPISATIASAFFEMLVKFFVALALYIFVRLVEMEIRFDSPILMIVVVFSVWLFSMSVGLAFGILSMFVPEVKKIETLITRPLFFISGVFFSLRDVPKEYWYLLDWNPILHAIELLRFGAFTEYGLTGVSLNYLLFFTLSFVFFALVVYQRFWKQAVNQ